MTETITTLNTFQTNDGQIFTIREDGLIQNQAGQIAIKVQRHAHPRQVDQYIFVPRANISLAWIEPEDVPMVLTIKRKGCCNKSQKEFQPANESDVRRWTNGGGR